MNPLSGISSTSPGIFSRATVKFHGYQSFVSKQTSSAAAKPEASAQSLLQIHQLRIALSAIKPRQLLQRSNLVPGSAATAASTSSLSFAADFNTRIQSTAEINTAPTSFQHNGPAWIGQAETAAWSGLGSTADATIGGTYDGSDGQGIFTFKVTRAGTHGEDDLRIRVDGPGGSFIQNINIDKNDPLNQVYSLSNGLSLTLGAGELVNNDTFEVSTAIDATSYTPNNPGWTGSSASPSIGGSYDGSDGTGDLTFRVLNGGIHGEDDLRIRIFAPDGSVVQTINIDDKDAIDEVYNLSNGLTFSLGEGELVRNETFTVSVDETQPNNYTTNPAWNFSSATPTFTGNYDGSNGSGTLTFRALDTGVHGEDDLRVRVYRSDGSTLETISIDANDPIDEGYVLSNGLTVTFGPGDLIRNETFSIDVETDTDYATAPNPVESTATPGLSGIYDGSSGTDTLTFHVTEAGIHGTDDLSLEVFTSDGTLVETVNIGATDPLDQSYSLANGLIFNLGPGDLALNETFTLDVYHLVPTSVDPDLAFDGTGIDDPKLEDQFTIVDGSFEINGTSIAVFSDDSINEVLDRISNAGIDITATFDSASERVVLTRDTPGSENDIVLGNDSSGFLAATKLSTAVSESALGGENSFLVDLQIMSGVSSGTLNINGTNVLIDINNDSLEDVLARIDLLVPNVDAEFDSATGVVSLMAADLSDLSISSGGTGFFEALQINPRIYEHVAAKSGIVRQSGYSLSARHDTARAINDFARQFNAVFADNYGESADPFLQQIRSELKAAISEAFGPNPAKSRVGIGFDFSSESSQVLEFSDSTKFQFQSNLKTFQGASEFHNLFFGHSQSDSGLTDQMLEIVKRAESSLSLELGSTGSFVDVWA